MAVMAKYDDKFVEWVMGAGGENKLVRLVGMIGIFATLTDN